ncbi:hypothetical protein PHAVU_004G122800 [Phaseolus vulgaris]|uniref:Uncharacterized protein n=1 Tax=Phaseolus vulgaris TaxID=3885 RepID=V7C2G4_PHAVU|nr:hypothetical protein PHAVU_004G122800g [Phaseolus vulgaris]ESW24347.1 hypothetical protein PHAVU_004G122800g [Phaseolus vulgaris]
MCYESESESERICQCFSGLFHLLCYKYRLLKCHKHKPETIQDTSTNSRSKLKQISYRAPLSWQVKGHPFCSFQKSVAITCQRRVALWLF